MASSTPFPSTDSDSPSRHLASTPRRTSQSQVHHPLLRDTRSSDPIRPPSALAALRVNVPTATTTSSPRKPPSNAIDSPPRSAHSQPARSRPTSPIRGILQWGIHRQERERETPFVPVDPFSRRLRRFSIYNSPDIEHGVALVVDPVKCEESLFCLPCPKPKDHIRKHVRRTRDFLTDTLPRQVYLHLMLRLPSLYFSRIARLFEDADVSQPDIDRLLRACQTSNRARDRRARMSPIPQTTGVRHHDHGLPLSEDWTTANVGPALVRFKNSWELFIDSLLREWKTLNIVSALLLSAILSMFQNQEMAYDPLVRTTALLSLTCALMSLLYGCVYIVRFATMKSMYKATRWAQETQRTTTFILWNVWVMLALPGVWLAWCVSMIFFIASILAFVWRSGSTTDPAIPSSLGPSAAIGPRVFVSAFFILGIIYFGAIVKTLQGYGRVNSGTGETETARETTDAIREVRDGREAGREGERGGDRGRGRERRRGRVNDRERDWKCTREDDVHESESEPAPGTYEHDRDDRGSSSVDVVAGLGLRGLDGVASPRASDERERERVRDVVHDVVYEESPEGSEGKDHRDGVASV
ncbi:hypothetical protein EV401DRAFT_1861765 [Pisolithus croceorrhizus]|nr:hypothetical protein EV401DRAFT_1861765 [Pisolithus croceorrhizus]